MTEGLSPGSFQENEPQDQVGTRLSLGTQNPILPSRMAALVAFQEVLAGSWLRSRAAGTRTRESIWDAGLAGSRLACGDHPTAFSWTCAVTCLALRSSLPGIVRPKHCLCWAWGLSLPGEAHWMLSVQRRWLKYLGSCLSCGSFWFHW